jgi:hypothetical protein
MNAHNHIISPLDKYDNITDLLYLEGLIEWQKLSQRWNASLSEIKINRVRNSSGDVATVLRPSKCWQRAPGIADCLPPAGGSRTRFD